MEFYLLRHTSTRDNELGINGSRTDTPLSEIGKKQAEELIKILNQHNYDLFVISPLIRTRQTLKPYLSNQKTPEVIVDELVIERDLGELTNTVKDDGKIKSHQKKEGTDRISWRPPGGESILDVFKRAEKFLEKMGKEYSGKTILICSHQNFLRCLEMIFLKRPIEDFYSENPPRLKVGELRHYTDIQLPNKNYENGSADSPQVNL